jgi:hypothetical protein
MRRVSLLQGERVWEKRRRRFALPAQSKKGFGVRWEAERHTAFSLANNTGDQF